MSPPTRNRHARSVAVPEAAVAADTNGTSTLTPLEAAELNTYTPHAEMFGHAVAVLSNSRVTFTIDDVLSILGHPVLGSVGAHGALMTKAAATGRIEPVGFTHSQRTGGIIRVWRGAGQA